MYKGFLHTHILTVTLFLLIYVVKTILLISDKNDLLAKFVRRTRVAEMIISALFLITGIYLATQLPFNSRYDYLFYIKLAMVFASIPVAIIGFKRGNKIVAALSLLLITGSYGIAEVYGKKKAIASTDINITASTIDGEKLYDAKCSLCHGNDGKLGASGAGDLSITSLDPEGLRTVILEGKGMMNAVDVSQEQAQAIATYVHEHLKAQPGE